MTIKAACQLQSAIEVCRNNKYGYSTNTRGQKQHASSVAKAKRSIYSTHQAISSFSQQLSVLTANGAHCSITSCLSHGQRTLAVFSSVSNKKIKNKSLSKSFFPQSRPKSQRCCVVSLSSVRPCPYHTQHECVFAS